MIVEAYAKINLTLEVLGKRPDGYHALRSLVQPIDLADTLAFTPAAAFSTDTGYPDDLILKAVKVLAESAGMAAPSPAFAIHVDKRIPAGGGLGGGSADAAATLRALNALWRLDAPLDALATMGARVGSDVPALVMAQHTRAPVWMLGRGEVVKACAARLPASTTLVMANPGVPSSTAEVYAHCRPRPKERLADSACQAAIAMGTPESLAAIRRNDLQASAMRLCPAIAQVLRAMKRAGLPYPLMSGSGSTVFAVAPSEEVALQAVSALRARNWFACLAHPL